MLPVYIFDRKRGRKVVVEYFSNNGFTVRDYNCEGDSSLINNICKQETDCW